VAIVTAIAWAYVRYGTLPAVASVMSGIQPVIVAIVVQAMWGLGRSAVKTPLLGVLAAVAAAATVLGVNELAVLVGAGVLAAAGARARDVGAATTWLPWPLLGAGSASAAGATAAFGLVPLFLVFLKVGAVLFGSGYVLLAFLRADLVEKTHWLTEASLLDAIAVGQITPGPVFTTATFIGYVLGGGGGAAVATIGIFLPAFVFVAMSGPLVPRLRASPTAGAFLDGVNVASLALMAVVTVELGGTAVIDMPSAGLALACTVVLVRWRVSSLWLVLAGALVGLTRGIATAAW
jgi:chromate transporter